MARSPTIAQAIAQAVRAQLADVRIGLPARVERYDAALQLVDVQPLVKEAREDEEGSRVAEQLPVIANVPVIFPGAGSYRLTFPIAQNDTVLVVFSAASLDIWLSQGGLVDPLDDSRFSLSDAVAIPGLRDFSHPLAGDDGNGAPTDRLTLGHDTGAQVNIDATEVRLGANTGVQYVALANLVLDRLTAIRNAFNVHVHGGAGTPPTVLLGAPAAVASSNVKAKE
jgi:hypothetical protein